VFVFQQDSAPANRYHDTVELQCRETTQFNFIHPDMWPAKIIDLNSPEYHISVYQFRMRTSCGSDLLRRALNANIAWWMTRFIIDEKACVVDGYLHFA